MKNNLSDLLKQQAMLENQIKKRQEKEKILSNVKIKMKLVTPEMLQKQELMQDITVSEDKVRIFRNPNNRSQFCILRTDKYENPKEILEENLSFEQASRNLENYTLI